MGVSSSHSPLVPIFQQITSWPYSRVQSICKYYHNGEYDFGVDATVICHLVDCSSTDALLFIKALSHSPNTTLVNALTWLVTLLLLSDSDRGDIDRSPTIYSIFDFNNTKIMSADELTIMILCVLSSFGFILNRIKEVPNDVYVMRYTEIIIYDDLNKMVGSQITAEEFTSWVRDHIVGPGYKHIDQIFDKFIHDCHKIEVLIQKEQEEQHDRIKQKRDRNASVSQINADHPIAIDEPSEQLQNTSLTQANDNDNNYDESYGDDAFNEYEIPAAVEGNHMDDPPVIAAETVTIEPTIIISPADDHDGKAEEKSITPTNPSIIASTRAKSPVMNDKASKDEGDDDYGEESFDAQSTSSTNTSAAETKTHDRIDDINAHEAKYEDNESKK